MNIQERAKNGLVDELVAAWVRTIQVNGLQEDMNIEEKMKNLSIAFVLQTGRFNEALQVACTMQNSTREELSYVFSLLQAAPLHMSDSTRRLMERILQEIQKLSVNEGQLSLSHPQSPRGLPIPKPDSNPVL